MISNRYGSTTVTTFLLGNLFFLFTASFCTHKIIYFISPPRSLSVTFLRMIEARGDFSIIHEPSQLAWNLSHSSETVQNWFIPDSSRSFAEVKKSILQTAEHHNVFVKEMSFAVRDFHINDYELMQNPHVFFVLLVRSPHHTVISMYKKSMSEFDTLSSQMSDLIGYKALYDVFHVTKHHAVNKPYIIFTENLYNNPEETIKKFCKHVGIEFKPESLHWNDLGENFTGHEKWHELKYKEHVHHWHGDAIRSTGFGKPASYAVDDQGNPTFTEITDNEHREICKNVYFEHMPYYKLLLDN